MHSLKFRAWDKVEKKMLFDADPFVIHVSGSNEPLLAKTHRNGDCIFEQYTGLKDKNGKEIYEGDIVREKWYDNDVHIGRDRIGKIEYFCAGFVCWFKGSAFVGLGMFPTKNIEVIGNIHENKELLESE